MSETKLINYVIISMIVFSASFHYGAYAAGFIGFFLLFRKDLKHIFNFVFKNKIVLFTTAALALSTLFSKVPSYSLMIAGIILLHFLVFLVLLKWLDNQNIENVFRLLNFMAVLICLYGLYQYYTGVLTIEKSWTDQKIYGTLSRIYSTLRNPNMFAAYLTFNLSYTVAYIIKKKGDIFTALNLILSSICLILTYSRGGFIAFACAMIVIAAVYREKKVYVYLVIMILVFYGYNFIGNTNRTDLGLLAYDSSSLYRLEIWKASWQLFKENIAFGSGLGSVSKLLSYSSEKLRGFIVHSHNIPLHLLAETGVIGFGAFTALVLYAIKKFKLYWSSYKHSEHSYIAAGFIGSLTAMLVHGMVDCPVLIPTRSLIFLIYLSLFPAIYTKTFSKQALLR